MGQPVKYITDDHGERTAVVLPISDYEKLLEDLEDLAVEASAAASPPFRTSNSFPSSSAMASFSLQWRKSTKKDLCRIPHEAVSMIIAEVEKLVDEPLPHGSEKLTGSERTDRIRIGDYRAVYELLGDSKIVEIQRVRHRKDVYR